MNYNATKQSYNFSLNFLNNQKSPLYNISRVRLRYEILDIRF